MSIEVPLNTSTIGPEEIKAVNEVLTSSFVTMGKLCTQFENEFAAKLNVKHAVMVNSGSSANLLAFYALAYPLETGSKKTLTPGSEVIVPAVTWSTTIWPVVQAGGIPVLIDADPETLQIKLPEVQNAMSDKTAAFCPVHILGNGLDLSTFKNSKIWIVEDTCESLGTTINGQYAGTQGDLGTYSFFFSHHMTTIEGGMVVTNDDNLAETLRSLRAHGWTRHLHNKTKYEKMYSDIDPRFLFVNIGFNLRPTELNAAIGICQLKKLDDFNKSRNAVGEIWRSEFKDLVNRELLKFPKAPSTVQAQWFGFPVLCKNNDTRNQLRDVLENAKIETRPIICGNLTRQPAFKKIKYRVSGTLTGADKIMDCGLYWGLNPNMETSQIDHVVKTVKGFFKSK